MTKVIKEFKHKEFGKLRTTLINNEPMYSYKDLCKILKVKNVKEARGKLNQHGVIRLEVLTNEIIRKDTYINEANMQRIYQFTSLESLGGVIDWIVLEVVPRSKLYGEYSLEDLIDNPDRIIEVLKDNDNLSTKLSLLKNRINNDTFRIKQYNRLYGERESIPLVFLSNYLKVRGVSQSKIMELLRVQEVIKNDNLPYQKYIDSGYFRIDEHKYTRNGEAHLRQTTIVFRPGINFIKKLLLKAAGDENS